MGKPKRYIVVTTRLTNVIGKAHFEKVQKGYFVPEKNMAHCDSMG